MSSSWTDVTKDSRDQVLDEDEARRACREVLLEIVELCRRKDYKRGQNILLIGTSGSGKSSFINTVLKALTGTYYPRADTGRGVASTKTLTLDWYRHCGVSRDDSKDDLNGNILHAVYDKLPTLIDAAGMGDNDNDQLEEILKLLLGGYIPPGTSMAELEKFQIENGVGELSRQCKEQKPEWRIDKVVFAQSCRSFVPNNLIGCLQRVLTTSDPKTGRPLYDVKTFIVMTKYDTVVDESTARSDERKLKSRGVEEVTSGSSDMNWVTRKVYTEKEQQVAKLFSIQGQERFSLRHFRSYCEELGYDSPYIDKNTLEFLKLLVLPGKPQESTSHPTLRLSPKVEPPEFNGTLLCLFIAVVVALLAWLMSKSI